jgi:beta-lactamase superfamily II metal-dependent hydrolase
MAGLMRLCVWDVEHGACAMLQHLIPTPNAPNGAAGAKLAMIDSGNSDTWRPSTHIRGSLNRTTLDYLFITNADQDHMSDLQGLRDAGIFVKVFFRNPSYTSDQIRQIKLGSGPLTNDAEWYVDACSSFNQPPAEPFDQYMGGITATTFCNNYPFFTKTNDLSLAVFIKYRGFSILFPGDLEKEGWRALLQLPGFREELSKIKILVASHHGRQNGFCPEVFDYCKPRAIVISDKPIEHETQLTQPDYRAVTPASGVIVRTTGKTRHVLTTRRDGWIQFDVGDDGGFFIDTEKQG